MLNIQEKQVPSGAPWLRLGFRPFFLGASIYAIVAVVVWAIIYAAEDRPALMGFEPNIWHAHEMLFGYGMAVIAGFLLTAIKNWTGQQTVRGAGLLLMFLFWFTARILPLLGIPVPIAMMAIADLLFMLFLCVAASIPVFKVKQYAQLGILSKLYLLLLSNLLFYLGALDIVDAGVQWGLYSGLYMILALLLVMARRVIPFFIEKGTGENVTVRNWPWVDRVSLVLLILLWLVDVFAGLQLTAAVIAAALFVVHAIRLFGWYTHALWKRPLLWVLYLAYVFIVVGFLLRAAEQWFAVQPFLYVHAFAYGGVGVMTIGMMSRVILGHTGRSVQEPPPVLNLCFGLLICGAAVRVLFPLVDAASYPLWIAVSQYLWIAAFLVFTIVYVPMLIQPRVDGRDG